MNKFIKRIALILVLAMLLTSLGGCNLLTVLVTLSQMGTTPIIPEITIPVRTEPVTTLPVEDFQLKFEMTDADISNTEAMIENCKNLSYSTTATRKEVEEAWEELDVQLDYISSQTVISQILYYVDLTDEAAKQNYEDAYDQYLALADKANLLQKDMYMDSPVKDWFFQDWPEQDIAYLLSYTSEIVELQSQITDIENQFLELSDEDLHDGYTELYVQLVTLGNQMAKLSGYDNYYDYKAALVYSRDYGKEEREQFRGYVKSILMPAFESYLEPFMNAATNASQDGYTRFYSFLTSDYDSLSTNYLESYINSCEGETRDYLNHAFENGNILFTDDPDSYEGAFCASLDYYDMSFCYFGPGYQTTSTVVHELGHYYASFFTDDYTCFDLLETHSQGNEALLLASMKQSADADMYGLVRSYDLYNKMLSLIICCMVDDYEERIYTMGSVENLTTEDIDRIIDDVCNDYFGAYGGTDYVSENVTDMQWYIRKTTVLSPAYYISYATSLVTTLNLYALAETDETAAREQYRKLVEEAPLVEGGYIAQLESCGAASPFDGASFKNIVQLFR